jgi:hypothetical protein
VGRNTGYWRLASSREEEEDAVKIQISLTGFLMFVMRRSGEVTVLMGDSSLVDEFETQKVPAHTPVLVAGGEPVPLDGLDVSIRPSGRPMSGPVRLKESGKPHDDPWSPETYNDVSWLPGLSPVTGHDTIAPDLLAMPPRPDTISARLHLAGGSLETLALVRHVGKITKFTCTKGREVVPTAFPEWMIYMLDVPDGEVEFWGAPLDGSSAGKTIATGRDVIVPMPILATNRPGTKPLPGTPNAPLSDFSGYRKMLSNSPAVVLEETDEGFVPPNGVKPPAPALGFWSNGTRPCPPYGSRE